MNKFIGLVVGLIMSAIAFILFLAFEDEIRALAGKIRLLVLDGYYAIMRRARPKPKKRIVVTRIG